MEVGIAVRNGDSQRVNPRIRCVDDEPNILVKPLSDVLALIARGHVATEQLIARLWKLGEGFVREPLPVADQSQPGSDQPPPDEG